MIKIFKYDFKALFRSLMPLYAAVAAMSLTLSVGIRMDVASNNIFMFMALVFGALVLVTCVLTIVLVVRRYRSSMMEDEAYLTFSLPVSIKEIVSGKLLSSVVWVLINTAALAAAAFIFIVVLGGNESFKAISGVLHDHPDEVLRVIQVCILGIIWTVAMISQLSLSFLIGHQFKNHQNLYAVAAFIVLIVAENFIIRTVLNNLDVNAVLALTVIQLIWIVLYMIGQWFILEKHLNLD